MFRRKPILALAAGLLGVAAGSFTPVAGRVAVAQSAAQLYVLPGDAVFPEGIAYQASTGDFFVSSTTDGAIFRGNVGQSVATPFLPGGADGRTTAVGLKVDEQNRLFIAGGGTGRLFVYDASTAQLIRRFDTGASPTFINDVALTPAGDAYFTDSMSPFLYRVFTDAQGELAFERFLDFTGTALVYRPGFNVNGITASPDGRYLIVVQSNTGQLFRVEVATRAVTQIDLGGATVTNGDGILLVGEVLYVVRNAQHVIAGIQLSADLGRGKIVSGLTDPTFGYPTTAAFASGRLLVVNSQFDRRGPGLSPVLPFTVSGVSAKPGR